MFLHVVLTLKLDTSPSLKPKFDDLSWCCSLHVTIEHLLKNAPAQSLPGISQVAQKLSKLDRTHGHFYLFVGLQGTSVELKLPRKNTWVLKSHDVCAAVI